MIDSLNVETSINAKTALDAEMTTFRRQNVTAVQRGWPAYGQCPRERLPYFARCLPFINNGGKGWPFEGAFGSRKPRCPGMLRRQALGSLVDR